MTYGLRARAAVPRGTPFPFDVLVALARVLQLREDDLTEFVLLGLLEACPDQIRDYVEHLKREVSSLVEISGRRARRYRIVQAT